MTSSQFDPQRDVVVTARETVFQGYFRVDRYTLRHRLFNGGWSRDFQRELFERGHAAAVLPYDVARDRVLLIEQFRIGPYVHGGDPWQIEIVAGILREGESPADLVRREAREEAGCNTFSQLLPICDYYISPGAVSEHMTLFCGLAELDGVGGVYGLAAEDEDIRVYVLGFDDAMAWLAAGRIKNSPAIIALQWLALNRLRLRAAI